MVLQLLASLGYVLSDFGSYKNFSWMQMSPMSDAFEFQHVAMASWFSSSASGDLLKFYLANGRRKGVPATWLTLL